ncbi:DUF3160 domain-containing protein, partial [Thermodesulfobacteriota bacterium]
AWTDLFNISRALEVIAHKQLRGVALNPAEEACIRSYGDMLDYTRNPKDDVPEIVDICTSEAGHLHAGIGRPRKIYVLYPWHGRNILCAGAILPYYEFASTDRLTDAAWKARLDSDSRPPVPAWLHPIVWGRGITKPDFSAR